MKQTITNKQSQRYLNEVFTSVRTNSVVYAKHTNVYNRQQELVTDIYQPENDENTKRPLVIFMHGGGFMNGSRKDDYIVQVCKSFAKRGYVTVSLSYRLGVRDYYNPVAYGEAVYRAVQDARAAVNFFHANALKFNIDTGKIFLGGGSAGAIAALHAAYWQQTDVPNYLDVDKLGPLDGNHISHTEKIHGIINCWGAVIDTSYIRKGGAPIVSIHGEKDNIVPFKKAGIGMFNLYGSYYIQQKAQEAGIKSVLKSFPDAGHGLSRYDTAKWNATINTISDFLFTIISEENISEQNALNLVNQA